MILEQLRIAAAQRGLTGEAFDRERDAYIEVGTLTAGDRTALDGLREIMGRGQMLAWMRRRFGPKALRLALMAYEDGIGGNPPSPHRPIGDTPAARQ